MPDMVDPEDVELLGLDEHGQGPWQRILHTTYHDDFGVDIYSGPQGAVITWNDYVVNQWSERYDSVALAVLRMGAVIEAGDNQRWFNTTAEEFATDGAAFFDRHMSEPDGEMES